MTTSAAESDNLRPAQHEKDRQHERVDVAMREHLAGQFSFLQYHDLSKDFKQVEWLPETWKTDLLIAITWIPIQDDKPVYRMLIKPDGTCRSCRDEKVKPDLGPEPKQMPGLRKLVAALPEMDRHPPAGEPTVIVSRRINGRWTTHTLAVSDVDPIYALIAENF